MGFMVVLLAFSCCLSYASSSIDELPVHPGVGGLYRGPNSETIIKGPDGSVITAEAQGGSVHAQPNSELTVEPQQVSSVGTSEIISSAVISNEVVSATATAASVVPVGAPTVAAVPVAVSAPITIAETVAARASAAAAPVVVSITAAPTVHRVEIIEPDPHIIETEIVDAPLVEPQESLHLVGPSGSISTRGSTSIVSGPASTTISEPARILVATPLIAAVPVISSVTTPLRATIPVEIVPEAASATAAVSTAPGSLQPTILSATLLPPINNVEISPEITISTASSLAISSTLGDSSVQISSTARPEVIIGPTVASTVAPSQGAIIDDNLKESLTLSSNRQLNINPSLIPSTNLISPEIGPIDLGSTVTVSSTPKVSVITSTDLPNIRRSDTVNSEGIQNENQVSVQNQIVVSNFGKTGTFNPSLLTANSFPVQIPQDGIIGAELAKYGIDSSQINLENVPLSSATLLSSRGPLPLVENVDHASSALWNRYGRDAGKSNENAKNYKN